MTRIIIGLLAGVILGGAIPSHAASDASQQDRLNALCHIVSFKPHANLVTIARACPGKLANP